MLFFGPKVILLLKRQSLEIYYKNSDKVLSIEFHTSAVRHLEVVSRDEVIKTLVEGFKNANLGKQTAIILLSDHIVFEKLISPHEEGAIQKEIALFYHNVPLDEVHIAKKIMPLKDSSLVLAANRELYQILIEVAHEFEWKINAVIPMTPFAKLAEDAQLTPDQVNRILVADEVFKEADFLDESVLIGSDKSPEKSPEEKGESDDGIEKEDAESKSNPLVTLLIALFLISLIIGSLFFFRIISLPFDLPGMGSRVPAPSTTSEASVSTTPVESTSSAQIQEASVSAQINREKIRIHVLNGSGISAQAAKVKEKLEGIGYTSVIIGNIESSEASGSSIVYSNKLEPAVKEEINKVMDSLIPGITKTEEAINEFNTVITLGKLNQPIE